MYEFILFISAIALMSLVIAVLSRIFKIFQKEVIEEDEPPSHDDLVGKTITVTADKQALKEIGIDRSLTNKKGVIMKNYDRYWFSVVFYITLGCGVIERRQYSLPFNYFRLSVDEGINKED